MLITVEDVSEAPFFSKTGILRRFVSEYNKFFFEAFLITKEGDNCINIASVYITQKEMEYFNQRTNGRHAR